MTRQCFFLLVLTCAVILHGGLVSARFLSRHGASSGGGDNLKAICILTPATDSSSVSGTLFLAQQGKKVMITGSVVGLEPNTYHGFHVHEYGDTRNGCNSTGGHFNPFNKTHGGPDDKIRHVGDTGNIRSDENGIAQINISDKMLSLHDGNKRSIIGRAFVAHQKPDDLGKGGNAGSLLNGNAGTRVACGVIGISA